MLELDQDPNLFRSVERTRFRNFSTITISTQKVSTSTQQTTLQSEFGDDGDSITILFDAL